MRYLASSNPGSKESKRMNTKLEPGDIFATNGEGIPGWAVRNLLSPATDKFHYGILWFKFLDDWVVIESTAKTGLAIGLLNLYKDYEIYRASCPKKLRHDAPYGILEYCKSMYDYLLVVKLFFGALIGIVRILLREHRIRRLRAEDFPYARNDALICTEVVQVAYLTVGVSIIDPEIVPLPNAFRQAELDGIITRIV